MATIGVGTTPRLPKRIPKRRGRRRSPLVAFALGVVALLVYLLQQWALEVELPSADRPVLLRCRQLGDDLRHELVTAIRQAQESVLIAVYTLSDPQVIQACNEQARKGVQVRVATDREAIDALRERLEPAIQLINPPVSGLMHRKILVVDRKWVWIGSANYTTASLCLHDNLTIALEAPSLGQWLWRYYQDLFNDRHSTPPYQASLQAGPQRVEVWLMPEASALEMLLKQIDGAQKTIRVALFAWTHPDLTQALLRAHKRGVKVEAIVDSTAAKGSSLWAVRRAKRAALPVLERGGRVLCHHKLAIIDDEQLITGSANWTRGAFEKNAECVIRVAPLTEEQVQRCHALWKQLTITTQSPTARPHWLWENGASGGAERNTAGSPDHREDESQREAA
jgi:cardiolipin synthase